MPVQHEFAALLDQAFGREEFHLVDELYRFREVGEYLMPFFEHVHDFLCEQFQDLERPIWAYTKYRFPDLCSLSCMTWDQKLSSGYCSRPPPPSSSSASQKVGLHFRTCGHVGFRPTSIIGLCYWPLELGVRGWLQVDVIGLVVLETDIFASSTIVFDTITLSEPGNLYDSGLCRLHRVREYDW